MKTLEEKIKQLKGPIVVLGGCGFVGVNLLRMLLKYRDDVYGTTVKLPCWRVEGIPEKNMLMGDLLQEGALAAMLDKIQPQTVFDCVAYGAYSFQADIDLIYKTNVLFKVQLIEELHKRGVIFVHAGTSSEYGDDSAGPSEDQALRANSHYSVTKIATANMIYYYGKKKNMPCVNLRLYSVYGPYEDSSRLIPVLVMKGLEGGLPEFVNPNISRDFVYTDDTCEAFIDAAVNMRPEIYGESYNIGTGVKTTMEDIANISRNIYGIEAKPVFNAEPRHWDTDNWYSNPAKAGDAIGWKARTSLKDGLVKTSEWMKGHIDVYKAHKATKKVAK